MTKINPQLKINLNKILLITLAVILFIFDAGAKNNESSAFLRLPYIFNNNMVIQREKPVRIFGSSISGALVTVVLNNIIKTTITAENGRWSITFDPLATGGPYQMKLSTKDTLITYSNILCGDVWLCSGQSNMDFRLNSDQFVSEELPLSGNNNLRLFTIPAQASTNKNNDLTINNIWQISETSSANNFSAVGYYFGKKIQTESGIPIGLIAAAWSGSTIEAWLSRDALLPFNDYNDFLDELDNTPITIDELKTRANNEAKRRSNALNTGLSPETSPFTPYGLQHFPSVAYNGNINPIKGFQLKGIIWYQGENNVAHAWEYKSFFEALINNWRSAFNDSQLPFYFVQLANYTPLQNYYPHTSQWAELRESQYRTLSVPNTGMAVTIDIGMKDNIHPTNKRDVGYRLGNLVLKNIYGKNQINAEFPELSSFSVNGSSITCQFSNTGSGLKTKDGSLNEFTIAGPDQRFYPATATIIASDKIELNSLMVSNPVAVRYAWSDCPENGLVFNSFDLPLVPFRTDNWILSTQPMPNKNTNEIVTIKTLKSANSNIIIPLIAGGTGNISVDWGNNIFVPVSNVSNTLNAPTFLKGTTLSDKAEIKIKFENRYLSLLNLDNCQISKLDVRQSANLYNLSCNVNVIDSLNLSYNTELKFLNCSNNNISTLDLTKNTNLINVQANNNKIKQITGLNHLGFMEQLSIRTNPLNQISLSSNQNVKSVSLCNTGLKNLNLSNNDLLETIDIYNSGSNHLNNFSACSLDSLYATLPDRTGKTTGIIKVISSIALPNQNDGAGSNKNIANQKNWKVTSYTNQLLTGDGGKCAPTSIINTRNEIITLKIQPNPANDYIKVEIPTQSENLTVDILDLTGKIIITQIISENVSIIDISVLKKGVYIVSYDKYKSKLVVR